MRRMVTVVSFVVLASFLLPISATAHGLYVGQGRISRHILQIPWSFRLNGSFGFHGAYRGLDVRDYPPVLGPGGGYVGDLGFSDWRYGHYGSAGVEFNLGRCLSLEPYGLYRQLDSYHNLRVIFDPTTGSQVYQSIESKVYGLGANLRLYKNWHDGAAYLGFGGGWAHGDASWFLTSPDVPISRQKDAGDFHLLTGIDYYAEESLSLGLELGWRWSGLDEFNQFDGPFAGLRVGVLLGRSN
jgi:hypothetical protein